MTNDKGAPFGQMANCFCTNINIVAVILVCNCETNENKVIVRREGLREKLRFFFVALARRRRRTRVRL